MFTRRRLTSRLLLGGVAGLALVGRDAFAQSAVQYAYDSTGRLIRVIYPNGSTIEYTYDAGGNRTQWVRSGSPPSNTFSTSIVISGTSAVNLRTLANTAGYNGAQNASITYNLNSGTTITGAAGAANGGIGLDTGDWPHTLYFIDLTLNVSGTLRGGGGRGGLGGNGDGAGGGAGGLGGDALYCRVPLAVTVNSGGFIQAGGGGGGGSAGDADFSSGEPIFYGGGGGGGGRPNGPGGTGSSQGNPGASGTAGTPTANGVGGWGAQSSPYGSGKGGDGGSFAIAGSTGGAGNILTGPGGVGGAAGFAIRKNGFAIAVTNNGTISGAQA